MSFIFNEWKWFQSFRLNANQILDKYSVKDMSFRWKKDNPITFPSDFDEGFFRLPKYVVSFSTEREPHILHYNDVDHCSARLEITLSREVKSYLLENYLPSTLFVSLSWGSFIVVPEIVPGRMVGFGLEWIISGYTWGQRFAMPTSTTNMFNLFIN